MKKIIVIIAAIAILVAVAIGGFNSRKDAPKNTEGISEMPSATSTITVASNGK